MCDTLGAYLESISYIHNNINIIFRIRNLYEIDS